MPTPSLLIVPARWKTGNPGKLYSQIPTNGDGDFNVTGVVTGAGNIGTRVNNLGYIESITTSGTPRLDYYTSSGLPGCPALLVEPSGSNSVLRSQDFSATWAATVSATVTGVTSPDGTANASTFIADATTSRVRQSVSLVSGTTYTYSLFGKFDALSSGFTMQVFEENTTTYGSGVCQAFNLNEGTLGASGSVGAGFTLQSAGMEDYGNGWYRCRMTVLMGYTTPSGATGGRVGFRIGTAISGGRPLSVVSGSVSAWGAQLETGSVATSYIPTTTASATRNADVISLSGAVSGCIGQTEGTIYAEFINTFSSSYNDGLLIRVFADANNEVFGRKEAASNRYTFRWRANSQNTTFTNVNVPDGVNKVALAYKSGDTALFLNGVQVGSTSTDVRAFSVNPTTVALGSNGGAGQFFNDRIRAAALYTTRLTNDQLMLLTMPGNNTYLPQAVWNNYLSRPGNDEVPDCLYTRHADLLDV
jgi:hypothetical protein